MDCSRPGFLVLHCFPELLRFMSIESVMLSNHLILCHPLLLLPSVFPVFRVFSSELTLCIKWPKYWSFSYSISPSNEYSWLSSFRIDSFNLLAFQGTLKSFLQHHSLKASILRHSAFFMVQLSHPYITTEKIMCLLVAQSCPTLWDPMDCRMPGSPVLHHLPELVPTHVHWVSDVIQPPHPLLPPSPPGLNPSQRQGLLQWVNSASGGQRIGDSASTSVLPMNTQDWSPLGWTVWIFLRSKGLSRVFSNTRVQKHYFFSTQLSL